VVATATFAVVGPAAAAGKMCPKTEQGYCEVCQAKERFHKLVPWLELGTDLRLRGYYILNPKLDKHHPSHELFFQRHRLRVWASLKPIADLRFNIRLMAEPRHWYKPDSKDSFTHCEAIFDKFNIEWSNVLGLPVKLTVGRQDMKLGRGWLIKDGTPVDGGRSGFFDAIRATIRAKDIQTTLDLVYVHNHADTAWFIRPFSDRDLDIAEHDESGVIVYLSNTSVEKHTIDAYFIYKDDRKVSSKGWNADLFTFGGRVVGACGEGWTYRGELAIQLGEKNGSDVTAMGADTEVAYHFKDAWKSRVRAQYEYRSGDEDTQDGAFDILWGRWYQGSNLWHFYVAQLDALIAGPSNYHRLAVGYACKPAKKWGVELDYHLLFRDRNPFTGQSRFGRGCFRGQLVTLLIKYDHNKHLKSHLMFDMFFPGDYYSNNANDMALFTKFQIILSW
jgi:hypothetical protein